jgi:toxin CcdB
VEFGERSNWFIRGRVLKPVMAQFDVHRNIGLQNANIPFVVIVQSTIFDDYRRRLVVPLVRLSAMPSKSKAVGSRLNPRFKINNVNVVLHPLDMASVPSEKLGKFVCSISEHGLAVSDALDEVLTRSWG